MAKKEVDGKYSKADLKKIKLLKGAEVDLTGNESGAELDALMEEHALIAGNEDEDQEVIPGVPNSMPVRHEPLAPGSKDKPFAVWHVSPVKGGFAMYDHKGRRVSHLLVPGVKMPTDDGSASPDEVTYHRKAAMRANVLRKSRRLPNDPE